MDFLVPDVIKKYNLNWLKQHLPEILILIIFVINSFSLAYNINSLQNPSTEYFTTDSSQPLLNSNNFYNTNPNGGGIVTELYNNFEVYNHSIITISGNQSVIYTFDNNFNSIISTNYYNFAYLQASKRFINNNSYVYNQYTSRITTDSNKTFILGAYLVNGTYGSYNLPEIDEFGGFNTNNFTTFKSVLHVPCAFPNQIEKYYPDTCYTSDIKLANSSVLLLLQNYGNEFNVKLENGHNINVYGTSLVFYDLNSKTILKSVLLPESNFIDYQYIDIPKRNNVWIYFTNAETYESGYVSFNPTTNSIKKEFTTNLNSLKIKDNYIEANVPLLLNSKILIFYQPIGGGTLKTYVWYSIQQNFINIIANIVIFIIIVVYFVYTKRPFKFLRYKN